MRHMVSIFFSFLWLGVVRARHDLNSSQYVIKVNAQDNGKPRLTSLSATIRIDTFRTVDQVVSFTLARTKNQFEQFMEADFLSEVTSTLRTVYPTAYIRRWCIHEGIRLDIHIYSEQTDKHFIILKAFLSPSCIQTSSTKPRPCVNSV